MVIMKKKRYSKSKIPVSLPISPTPILTLYKKLLSSFFTFIIDIFIDISIFLNDTYNNDTYNFNSCCIYGNKD